MRKLDNPGSAGVRSAPDDPGKSLTREQGVRRWIASSGSAGARSTPDEEVRRWIDARELVHAAPLATAFDGMYITARNP